MTNNPHGGKRDGAGRPKLPPEQKRKPYTVLVTDEEKQKVKEFIQAMRKQSA